MPCVKSQRLFALLCIIVVVAVPVHAQIGHSGTVAGVIAASDGSPLAHAVITLSGQDGFQRTGSTSSDGAFSILDLPSGTYTLKVAASGFKTLIQPSVSVATGHIHN